MSFSVTISRNFSTPKRYNRRPPPPLSSYIGHSLLQIAVVVVANAGDVCSMDSPLGNSSAQVQSFRI